MRSFSELLQSPRALKALVAGGGVLSLLLLGLLTAPAFVRGKVEREARARGFDARVGRVSFGLQGVWLEDVNVTSRGDDFELRLGTVSLNPFTGAVKVVGGVLRGSGDPSPVLSKLRTKGASSGVRDEGGREVSLRGLYLRWDRDATAAEAFGVQASRTPASLTFGADLARFRADKTNVEVRGLLIGTAARDGHRQLVRLETRAVELAVIAETPPATAKIKGSASPRGPPPAQVSDEPALASRLRQLRALLLPLVREGLADGANLALDGFTARIERAKETLSFGPSRLALLRAGQTLQLSLSPNAVEPGVTPLALNLSMPLTSGSAHLVAKGGPISLSSLGVRRGQLGLQDVHEATVAADGTVDFSEDFESVELDGQLSVHGLSLQRVELSPQAIGPLSFDAALKARALTDGSELRVTSGEAHLGEVRAELSGEVATTPGHRRLQGRLRVPLSGCQSLLDAMPNGLLPLARGVRLSGSFGIDFQVGYDSSAPKETRVVLAVQNECRVQDAPLELSPHRFEHPFMREVKAPDGSPMTLESGPGTPSWVSLDDMSKHLETAILICEDSRFYAHAGFDFRALEDAIKDDLRQGRFARGASTVSMQLAKNLYLGKEKTLGRKLQEAIFTMLLEQQLDKRRILELYLNVVELGPGLYGVGDAAQYYFATPARALTLGQSLYLATLLPNPMNSRFSPDGKLNPAWLAYLHRLMQIAHKIKRVDDAELQAGLEEEIAFRVPGAAVPERAPDGNGLDEAAPPELSDDPDH